MYKFQELVDKKCFDNKNIQELLMYDGICYWWQISWNIYTNTYNEYNKSNTYRIYDILNSYLPIDYLLYIKFKFFEKIYYKDIKKDKSPDKSPTIIIREAEYHWRLIYDSDSDKMIYKNMYHGDIIDAVHNINPDVKILLSIGDGYSYNPRRKIKYYKSLDSNLFPFIKYGSLKAWHEKRKAYVHFKKIWRIIKDNHEWFEEWARLSNHDVSYVISHFRYRILYTLPTLVGYSNIIDKMIADENPSLLFQSNEQDTIGRLFTVIAGKHNIPMIALQHGINGCGGSDDSDYTYHNDTDICDDVKGTNYPIPNLTFVFGKWDYDLLTVYGHYPKSSVKIIGYPRYDALAHASEMYSRDEFCKRYNINPKNKIILWASDLLSYSSEENRVLLDDVFSAVSEIENTSLIIKEHPGEDDYHTQLINEYISKYHLDVLVPDKSVNITEYIYICDLMIHQNSTCGQEAAAFHKPMIILDFSEEFSKERVSNEYVNENAAILVYKSGMLKQIIADIFENGCDMKDAQDEYVRNHMYKIDGLASQRAADIIMQYLKKDENKLQDK